jgi:hypothetical protein
VWVPVLPPHLKKRIAVTVPSFAGVNAAPSSTAEPSSVASTFCGSSEPNIV